MVLFVYDKSFEGLLTAVFDAYFRRTFPDRLLAGGEPFPLFYDEAFTVCTDAGKANRVWNGLQKKVSPYALSYITTAWLSELPGIDELLFRYIRKALDAPRSMELNFGDPDILEVSQICKKVSYERHRAIQFARFQKAADGTFFSAFEPLYNVLPLAIGHFKDRFAFQPWLVYDIKREYGYFFDRKEVAEVTFESKEAHLLTGWLSDNQVAPDEKFFQELWAAYFRSAAIRERTNPKLHRQNLPVRFWKYLTEKRG